MIALKWIVKWGFEFNSNYVVASYLGQFTACTSCAFCIIASWIFCFHPCVLQRYKQSFFLCESSTIYLENKLHFQLDTCCSILILHLLKIWQVPMIQWFWLKSLGALLTCTHCCYMQPGVLSWPAVLLARELWRKSWHI